MTRLLPALLLFFALALPANAAERPADVVTAINESLIDTMKNAETLGFQGRYEKLEPVLREAFDFPFMARVAVGSHWKSLNEEQRQNLVEAFSEMSIATYANRFDGYSGETIRMGETVDGPRETRLVKTDLVKSDGETIALNYVLRQEEGQDWRVIDVYLDAKYSELATKRSEYTSVIKNEGFEALIAAIEAKAGESAD